MTLLSSEHTLGLDGIGPRTLLDNYDWCKLNFQVMCQMVACSYSDYDIVSPWQLDMLRSDREDWFRARALYLGY